MAILVGQDDSGTKRAVRIDNEGKLVVKLDNASEIFYIDDNGNLAVRPAKVHYIPTKAEILELNISENNGVGTYNLNSPSSPVKLVIYSDDYVKVTYKDTNDNTLAGPGMILADQKLELELVNVAKLVFDCSPTGSALVSVHEFQPTSVRI